MKLFTCTDHEGMWPVGVASIIIANSESEARDLLIGELEKRRLYDKDFTLCEVDLTAKQAVVLMDGEY